MKQTLFPWLVFLFTFFFYFNLAFSFFGLSLSAGDETEYIAVARSLIYDQDLNLVNQANGFYLHRLGSFSHRVERISNLKNENLPKNFFLNALYGRNKEFYPYHPLGLSVLIAPGVFFLEELGAKVIIIFFASLLLMNIYLLNLELSRSHNRSLVITALLGSTLPILSFSVLAFTEIVAAFILLYSTRNFLRNFSSPVGFFLTLLLLAFLPWVHIRYMLPILVFFAFVWFKRHAIKRPFLLFCLSLLSLSLANLALFYLYFYGDLKAAFVTGNPGFGNPLRGALALLFDQEYGLWLNSPLYLLSILGIFVTLNSPRLRKNIDEVLVFTLVFTTFVFYSFYEEWHGGFSPPARYLVPVLPFLSIYINRSFSLFNNKKRKIFATLLITLSVLLSIFNLNTLGFSDGNCVNEVFLKLGEKSKLPLTKILPSFVISKQCLG